uniref:TetR/AcrR family transcriptional regulator n=1 Tax=Phenylobacterium glaciei TaxID=2803784 RepID=A0A974P6L6_9CAUL|nr:TetR/AcrR family transcriptional regulator [Phenylobacterium glaciei]
MRARLIDAAVDCLNRLGYSATTLSTIAEAAGVSRGGMLHQFPSKVDLMLAVVAYASGADERSHQPPALNDDDDKLAYFMSRTETTWTVLIQEPAMAKLEIMMAARSDKVLAAKLPDMFNSIEQNRRHRMWSWPRRSASRTARPSTPWWACTWRRCAAWPWSCWSPATGPRWSAPSRS